MTDTIYSLQFRQREKIVQVLRTIANAGRSLGLMADCAAASVRTNDEDAEREIESIYRQIAALQTAAEEIAEQLKL